MAKALLIVAAIVDVAIAVLLVAVSGFIIGDGPESMHAGTAGIVVYFGAVVACLVAPVAGFLFLRRGQTAPGLIIALMPPAGALMTLALPPPY